MIDQIITDTQARMEKSLEALRDNLVKIRTGRAHPSLLEHISVDYYGSNTPLSQIANISIADARTLQVVPWEKTMIAAVEKAIMVSDLGLNPSSAGQVIRVPLPALTEERRRDLVKIVKGEAENARVAIRNIRRDANNRFKDLLKQKEMSEDDERRAQDRVQKVTDKCITDVESIIQVKEKELIEI
ncbi:Ribosome-releasing factor [Piscirickettsia salmonis]|uniref:Ribosome-recycling factor n=1 Tax=Piscirickettsia salmonis TaxID=1238 RepID=A0A1L6T9N1_PISSA|nr:ribosome recycling factor [Piscirickettsia salmonis]AKP73213.2 ribosome recycling factor [Piscirickettsia salmonis LF-89 = ATCC VR-1361]ALB21900.1 ribosome recycling factor [Piscirickettsia salmonis]ALY02073.1 ribosome recycling factor [Piscirickettsia salmonis]AMA41586.1 ribosome recycling factor [Piscirickettsia salmonis]AOS34069.1 ribosome recycling factor [Piscirickettsia salmonis]